MMEQKGEWDLRTLEGNSVTDRGRNWETEIMKYKFSRAKSIFKLYECMYRQVFNKMKYMY